MYAYMCNFNKHIEYIQYNLLDKQTIASTGYKKLSRKRETALCVAITKCYAS